MKLVSTGALRFEVGRDHEAMSRKAAAQVIAALRWRPDLLLCASAGGTPTRLYEILAERRRHEPLVFSKLRIIAIDEWFGLPMDSPARCVDDLERKLVAPLGVSLRRFTAFRSDAVDPEAECRRIRSYLCKRGPVDVCILGLGTNGHIAMIEPAAELAPDPHVARLARSSLSHPLLSGMHPKPTRGLSIGMGDVLRSSQALLLAAGEAKREAVRRLRVPSVTTRFPASFLWLHANATVFCDRTAFEG